jgi:hypothetical protein
MKQGVWLRYQPIPPTEYQKLADAHPARSGSRIQTENTVFTLLFMLMARCFDRLEAAAVWLRRASAVSAPPAAAILAASGRAPCPVAIPVPPPDFSRWL